MKHSGVARRVFMGTTCGAVCGWMCGNARAATGADACVDAICGIYCGACSALMESMDAKNASEVKCLGCRSTKKIPGYAPKCKVRKCAKSKMLQSCGLCKHYPCDKIEEMFNETPKYGLREKYLNTIRDKGLPAWLEEMKTRWTCKECQTPFGYDTKTCKKCGKEVWSAAQEFDAFKKSKDKA